MKRIFWLGLSLAVLIFSLAGCNKHNLKDDCADYCNKLISCNFDWWELTTAECVDFCKQDVDDDYLTENNVDCVLGSTCSAMESGTCDQGEGTKYLSAAEHFSGSAGPRNYCR